MDEIICHLGELEGSNSAIDETDPNSQLIALESQWTFIFFQIINSMLRLVLQLSTRTFIF